MGLQLDVPGVGARQIQQIVHQAGKAARFVQDDRERVAILGGGALLRERDVGLAADHRDGRAQFVRGVGDEAAHGVEGLVEAREQFVERSHEDRQFLGGVVDSDAGFQIAAGDATGLVGHPAERAQAARGQPDSRRCRRARGPAGVR